jgi:hypothetical protein
MASRVWLVADDAQLAGQFSFEGHEPLRQLRDAGLQIVVDLALRPFSCRR